MSATSPKSAPPHDEARAPVWSRAYLGYVALSALFALYAWTWKFSGDAMIHVSFMEQAANGRWFEFNPGIPDASSTSALWTILGATLWKIGGPVATGIGLKVVCVAAWVVNGLLVARLSRSAGAARWAAAAAGLSVLAIPSTAINSLTGMENATYSCFVLGGIGVLIAEMMGERPTVARTMVGWGLLGLAAATRPEAVVAIGILGVGWLTWLWRFPMGTRLRFIALGALAGAITSGPFWGVYMAKTGRLVPESGVSRKMVARRGALTLQLGDLWVYGRPLAYVGAYLPLAAGAAAALFWARDKQGRARWLALAVSAVVLAALSLYTFVTGAAHASRYLIWVFALLAVPAAWALSEAASGARGRRAMWGAALGAAWMVGVVGADNYLRTRTGAFGPNAWGHGADFVVGKPDRRKETTDALIDAVCAYGCCEEGVRPAVATIEVQLRYELDERVRVMSLDGVVTGPFEEPMTYRANGCPDWSRFEADRSLVGIYQAPSWAMRLDQCIDGPWIKTLEAVFADHDVEMPGWKWEPHCRILVRDCRTEAERAADAARPRPTAARRGHVGPHGGRAHRSLCAERAAGEHPASAVEGRDVLREVPELACPLTRARKL